MCCVLHCSVTHCYLCSASSLPGTLELFVGICSREPVCKQWNITIFWKYILFTLNQWNIEAILQYCGDISSSPRRLVFEKPAVTIEHRLLQFLHIANLTGRGNLISNLIGKIEILIFYLQPQLDCIFHGTRFAEIKFCVSVFLSSWFPSFQNKSLSRFHLSSSF